MFKCFLRHNYEITENKIIVNRETGERAWVAPKFRVCKNCGKRQRNYGFLFDDWRDVSKDLKEDN